VSIEAAGRRQTETIAVELDGPCQIASRPGDSDETWASETVPLEVAGSEVWLSMVGVALAEGIVYAFRDVTRERRLERVRSEFHSARRRWMSMPARTARSA